MQYNPQNGHFPGGQIQIAIPYYWNISNAQCTINGSSSATDPWGNKFQFATNGTGEMGGGAYVGINMQMVYNSYQQCMGYYAGNYTISLSFNYTEN